MLRKSPYDTVEQAVGLAPSAKFLAEINHTINHTTNGTPHKANGAATNGSMHADKPNTRFSTRKLLTSYAKTSLFITLAAPFGFTALSYISYPTMVLAKSCKLVPVMIMNFLLYRRKFAPHKYLVVAMVTLGITVFMYRGDKAKSKKEAINDNPYAQLIGISYLLINLILDGTVNSTQDEIFSRYKVTGQQMMLWINIFTTCISMLLLALPLPYIPVIHESTAGSGSELLMTIEWIKQHPSVIYPIAEFSVTGALGQLFIFETLQHFGSLTLVYVSRFHLLYNAVLTVIYVLLGL
jgi:solute carrier family 35 (UDP-galactose transporter), member B1